MLTVTACGGHRGFLVSPPSGFCFFNISSSLWDGSIWAFHLPCFFLIGVGLIQNVVIVSLFFFPQLPPSRSHVVAQWQRGRKHRVLVGGPDSSHTERPERAQHCHTGTERTIWGQGSRCTVSLFASAFLPRPLVGPCFSLSSPFLALGVSPVFLPLAFSHLSGLCHAFSSAYSETLCNIGCFNVLQVVHIPVSCPEEPPTCLQSDFPGPGHSLCTRLTGPKAKALPNPS